MSDYKAVEVVPHSTGAKVTASCGFGWFGPPSDDDDVGSDAAVPLSHGEEAVSAVLTRPPEDIAVTAHVDVVNPHHPRFVPSSVKPSITAQLATDAPVVDERDYGTDDSDSETDVSAAVGAGGLLRASYTEESTETVAKTAMRRPLEPYETLQQQMERMKRLRATETSYAEAIMLQVRCCARSYILGLMA
jgi:hypothetical protein